MIYEDVANKVGLDPGTKERFVKYMRLRWADEEETQCITGYAEEWAYRFKNGIEFVSSDINGQAILSNL